MTRWRFILGLALAAPGVASPQLVTGTTPTTTDAGGSSGAAAPVLSCTLNGPLDRTTTRSSDCLTCHDGSKVTSGAPDARTGHRYDVEYYTAGKPDLRESPTSYDPRVVLPGNKITCCTCHDPASTLPYHLAASTSGDVARRLCVACHVQ